MSMATPTLGSALWKSGDRERRGRVMAYRNRDSHSGGVGTTRSSRGHHRMTAKILVRVFSPSRWTC